jgi:DNA-binding response OmpR family regulator
MRTTMMIVAGRACAEQDARGGDMASKHVILVDDDPEMRALVSDFLIKHAFDVSAVSDSTGLARVLAGKPADLIILDLNLGHEDGLDLMRGLSGKSDAPVIVITGDRGEEADKVVALELGADDYLTKPFGLRELLARARAVLRRAEGAEIRTKRRGERQRYRFEGWELDMRMRRLTNPGGEAMKLTAGEFNLLVAMLRAPQQVLSREQLISSSRVHDDEVFDRSIDVQILRLRRKLEEDPAQPRLIKTERSAGYVFTAEVQVA